MDDALPDTGSIAHLLKASKTVASMVIMGGIAGMASKPLAAEGRGSQDESAGWSRATPKLSSFVGRTCSARLGHPALGWVQHVVVIKPIWQKSSKSHCNQILMLVTSLVKPPIFRLYLNSLNRTFTFQSLVAILDWTTLLLEADSSRSNSTDLCIVWVLKN